MPLFAAGWTIYSCIHFACYSLTFLQMEKGFSDLSSQNDNRSQLALSQCSQYTVECVLLSYVVQPEAHRSVSAVISITINVFRLFVASI